MAKIKKRKGFVALPLPTDEGIFKIPQLGNYSLWASTVTEHSVGALTREMLQDAMDRMIYGDPGMYYARYEGSVLEEIVKESDTTKEFPYTNHYYMQGIREQIK